MENKAGEKICGCTLRLKCGQGAYGEVWLAEDSIGARVAVKIISNQGRYSERELAGLKNYRDCNHPNLLKIRYVEIAEDRICCIMDAADDLNRGKGEYLPDTLANRLNKFGRLEGKEVVAMLDGLLAGLEELHAKGLVHRDIKPDNILWVNGRPTLADVGLVSLEGRGSLVGTPGFMSPKLLSGKGPAEAADDFYALGKVIYCALTGLPVGEYPSIPENMTISMDAALGHALRESCKRPIRSSAEFRKLLEGKRGSTRELGKSMIWIIMFVLIFPILIVSSVFLRLPDMEIKTGSAEYKLDPDSAEAVELDKTLKKAEAELSESQKKLKETLSGSEAEKDLRDRVLVFLRKIGFLPGGGNITSLLLDHKIMTRNEILDLVSGSDRDPRLIPSAGIPPRALKKPSQAQRELSAVVGRYYQDFESGRVKERQEFWRKQPGASAEIQRKMLESDPLMQAVAMDIVIRHGINSVLKNGKISEMEKKDMEELLQLREELLNPLICRSRFMGRKF